MMATLRTCTFRVYQIGPFRDRLFFAVFVFVSYKTV